MNTFTSLIIHYVYGLFAQSWNGAIATIVVLVKDTTENKAGALAWSNIWHAFLIGLAVTMVVGTVTSNTAVLTVNAGGGASGIIEID